MMKHLMLMMKSFSTVRDTWKGTQLHGEEKREEGDRGDQEEKLCLTLSNPMDCSLLGSSTHGFFQARVLEWDAIAFSGDVLRLL